MNFFLFRWIWLFFIFWLHTYFSNAQPYKVLNMPIKYGTPQENVDYSPVNEAETSSALWFVCSDRNNNTTYRQPNGNERFKTIQFLDKFYVIGEEGEYIRLAKGNSEDLEDTEDKISLNGEDYGWIHKKNVLLRKTPLACNHIPEKVVFFNTVKKGTSSIDIESNKYTHTNPNLDNKYKILPISLNDLFVYKEERNSLLLIRDKFIREYDEDFTRNIVGWVDKNTILPWNNRIAIEPNWENPAVQERLSHNTDATVFYRDFDAKAYKEGHTLSKKNILWQEENISQKRQAGNIMRFPVLEDDGEILKLGVLGKIYNEYDLLETNSFNNVNNDINFFIQENNLLKINKLKSSKSIINVIFVVEGTKNMDIYHKAICNEVKRNSNLFRDNLNTFKFGGVVYCDNEIKGSIIQRKKPTTNIRSFTDFFGQEIKTYDEDENVGNSVNYGLYDALKTMGLKATETNVIVLVGREGNHVKSDKTQIEVDEIIQLMNGYNCQFFTFAADIPSDEYEELIYEARSFILGVAHIKHKYLLKNLPLFFEKNIFGATTKPRLFPKIDNKNAYFLKNTPITGEIYHAEYGEQISILDFQKNLKDLFLQVDSQTTKLLEIGLSPANWDEAKSELNPKNSGSSYNVQWKRLDFLLAAGLTENEIRKVWEVKEISSIGYAPKKIKHHSSPLFNYSILMTQKDLLNLYMKMRKVTHEYNRNTSIDEIQTELLFLHILTIAIRTGQTVEYLSNLSMDKIQNIRYKLPTNNGYPMCCRTDIDEIDLKHYMNYLDQKIRQLENIINGFNYPYSFTKNDITYYWISEDFLP